MYKSVNSFISLSLLNTLIVASVFEETGYRMHLKSLEKECSRVDIYYHIHLKSLEKKAQE